MCDPQARRWLHLVVATSLAATLLMATAPAATAEDAPPPGATDGVPTAPWDAPLDGPIEGAPDATGATPAAIPQRYFGAGAFTAIERAVAATSRSCSIANQDLVAMALAPVFKESAAATSASGEPAPMTLSRYDEWSGIYPPPSTNTRNANYVLYAFENPYTQYTRAFWHPGVGIWQYDSAGVGAPFTAAERVDVGIVSGDVASEMARKYCAASGSTQDRRYAAWRPWGNPCYACQTAYNDLVSTGFGSLTLTDDVSATGGMATTSCASASDPTPITCHYIDPQRAEGARWWLFQADGGSPTSGVTPLSYPFYVVKRNGYEERHWLREDTGYAIDIMARRKLGNNARPWSYPGSETGLTWVASTDLCEVGRSTDCGGPVAPGTRLSTPIADRGAALPLRGDFNGDGRADLFWYAAGGATDDQWTSNGDTTFTTRTMTVSGSYEPLVGDLDGDQRDDIFWYAAGPADDYIWWSGDKATSQALSVKGTYSPLVGDFDGNGRDEIFWYAPGSTPDSVWSWTGSRQRGSRSQNVSGTYQPLLGDFDGDAATDVFWYAPGAAADNLWYGRTGGFTNGPVNVSGVYRPLIGDYDDDGSDDIIWYRAGADADYTWFGEGRAFVSVRNDIFGTYEAFVVDLDPRSAPGGDDVVFYGPGSAADVRWHGRTDRTFDTTTDIDLTGTWFPIVGRFAGTSRGDVVFWDITGSNDILWSA